MTRRGPTRRVIREICGLEGENVVFTGRFDPHRHMVQHLAEEAGAVVSNHVSANTTILVLGRPNSLYKHGGHGTKIAAARSVTPKTSIAEISDETFRILAAGGSAEVLVREGPLLSVFGVPAAVMRRPEVGANPTEATVLGDAFDRATRAHHDTLMELIRVLSDLGHTPLTPGTGMPAYDLAVETGDAKIIIEIKSIQPGINEIEQVRLGVGQVLHYIGMISAVSRYPLDQFVPVVVTSEAASPELVAAFKQHGIAICHPGDVQRVVKAAARSSRIQGP